MADTFTLVSICTLVSQSNKQNNFKININRPKCEIQKIYSASCQGIIQKKIWAHWFLAKPKTIEAEGLGGAASAPRGIG